jgi:hypothetical protein
MTASLPRRENNSPPDMFKQIRFAVILRIPDDFSLLARHARAIADVLNGDRGLPSMVAEAAGLREKITHRRVKRINRFGEHRGGHPQNQEQREQANHGCRESREGFTGWERIMALKASALS